MLRIPCPWCGERDETEFRYRGDASVVRPDAGASLASFIAYAYERGNHRGWHLEWWLHVGGCRKLLKVARHTLTHEIHSVAGAGDRVTLPDESAG
jgi:sarcosine oxidase subunit delta